MNESKKKLVEMREHLLSAIAGVQMKLKSIDTPTAPGICSVCESGCTACNGSCVSCQSTKTV